MSRRREVRNFICREDYPVAETAAGKYRGFVDGDVCCFRGIPYANAARFHEPQPAEPFEGVRNAVDYGPVDPCMSYRLCGAPASDNILINRQLWYKDENCLNLNIWTKSIEKGVRKPVMVWLHGGGFAGGNALDLSSYDGWEMSHCYDVVLVTVNHRLNLSGFLDLSAYGDAYARSGILGMLDLVAALKWVRDHIAAFGGDPGNVTIYGQSGGGAKVTTLMQMPAADGLYHKAIVQSGVFPMGTFENVSAGIAELALETLKIDKEHISKIETVDYDELGGAVVNACLTLGISPFGAWAPVPDGASYIGDPQHVGFREETKHVPVIAGSCLAEFSPVPAGDKGTWSETERREALADRYNGDAAELWAAFSKAYPQLDTSYAACVDTMVRPATLAYLKRRKKEADAAVYNYVFTFESLLMGGQITGHNGDLHFMFHNARYLPAMYRPDVTERLQDEMAGAWAAFAHTGSPNGSGLPEWREYDEKDEACMCYGPETALRYRHDAELLALAGFYKEALPDERNG